MASTLKVLRQATLTEDTAGVFLSPLSLEASTSLGPGSELRRTCLLFLRTDFFFFFLQLIKRSLLRHLQNNMLVGSVV